MDPRPDTPMWLSHHHPDAYERCVSVAGRHVCRRCAVMYPVAIAVAVIQAVGLVDERVGTVLMWVTPIPVVADWVGEHVARRPYSPTRQVATSAVAALGLGVALGIHAEFPFAARAVLPMATAVLICLAAWVVGLRRSDDADDWELDFERAESERTARLEQLLVESDAA